MQSITSKLSSVDKQNRYDQALSNFSLVEPTRPGFVKMYEPAFWCKSNPMDFCYGDLLHNDPRGQSAMTYEQYCENLLRREQLQYGVYEGEHHEAEHYGGDHWHLRCDVKQLLERYQQALEKKGRSHLEVTVPQSSSTSTGSGSGGPISMWFPLSGASILDFTLSPKP